jgi:hypothetical protein
MGKNLSNNKLIVSLVVKGLVSFNMHEVIVEFCELGNFEFCIHGGKVGRREREIGNGWK